MNASVVHLTSAHSRYDTRIFLKECRSLASAGFDVGLVVADGLPDEEKDGVSIYGVEKAKSRIDRMRNATQRVFRKALELDADVYHLHDPELMPIGLKLKRNGKKVIFDAHEDLPQQLLSKPYGSKLALRVLSFMAKHYESYACSKFDAVVTAVPITAKKFASINNNVVDVKNYPVLEEVLRHDNSEENLKDKNSICYVGGLTENRGVLSLIRSLEYLSSDVRLNLAGWWESEELKRKAECEQSWRKVNYKGVVDRVGIAEIYAGSKIGMVTLQHHPNYMESLPVKMFEYMGAGLPVIASNIPFWEKIVDQCECGVCVDPYDPKAIASAISYFLENPDEALKMGKSGRRWVIKEFNWEEEEKGLLSVYDRILKKSCSS